MGKKSAIMTGIILYVLLISTIAAVQATPAVVSVSPPMVNTTQGQIFTINITVDPKGNEIYGVQYVLYFNTSILKALVQTHGTFLSHDGVSTDVFVNETNNTLGKIVYAESRTGVKSGVTSPGVLASVSFEAIGASGQSGLKLSDVKLVDPNVEIVEVEINDGICNIGKVTSKPAVVDLTVEEVYQMLKEEPEEIILLDVRTEEEYNAEHIVMPKVELKNIPKNELESRLDELDKTKKVIVYCKTGVRSKEASGILAKHGFVVYNMLGGIKAWRLHRDFPMFRPTPTPSPMSSPKTELTPTITPSRNHAAASPSPAPASASTSTPEVVATTPTTTTSPTRAIGGFEVAFPIATLAISYLVLKRWRRQNE